MSRMEQLPGGGIKAACSVKDHALPLKSWLSGNLGRQQWWMWEYCINIYIYIYMIYPNPPSWCEICAPEPHIVPRTQNLSKLECAGLMSLANSLPNQNQQTKTRPRLRSLVVSFFETFNCETQSAIKSSRHCRCNFLSNQGTHRRKALHRSFPESEKLTLWDLYGVYQNIIL